MRSYDTNLLQTFPLPSAFPCKAKSFTSPNETLSVCVCADLTSLTYIYYKLQSGNTLLRVQIVIISFNLPFQSTLQIIYLLYPFKLEAPKM